MNEMYDGGPAYPCRAAVPGMSKVLQEICNNKGGLSLQDIGNLSHLYPALMGMMSRDRFEQGQSTPEQRAKLAYIEADAMIYERNNNG
jgi:hypothetical protein